MNSTHTEPIDVTDWTRLHSDKKDPFWWGILGLIAIEMTVVAGFVVSFFYLWIVSLAENRLGWTPDRAELPPLLYPSLNTVLLIICSISMYYGGVVMEKGQNWRFVWSVVVCCGAGAAALWFRWLQFEQLPVSWDVNAYAGFVWVLTGFHFMHAASAILGTAVIGWFAAKGFYTQQRRLAVQVDTMYWYFVSAAWVLIYVVIYWAPRLAYQ